MTRTFARLLVIFAASLALSWSGLAATGSSAARAQQPIADPGFGDPTLLGGDAQRVLGGGAGTVAPMTQPSGFQPPLQPGTPIRPQGWPGSVPPSAPPASGISVANLPPGAPRGPTVAPDQRPAKRLADPPYDPADILAIVGSERIQGCEVLPRINQMIMTAAMKDPEFAKLPAEQRKVEIERAQKNYLKAALGEMVKSKLLVSEIRSQAPKESLAKNEKQIRDFFNTTYLKEMQKEYQVNSVLELENKLQEYGGSLESQRTLFVEQQLANGWLSQAVKKEDREATHDELLDYYRRHGARWDTAARVRWEQVTARFSNFGSREEALGAMAHWGNDVLVRKVPFAEVAKAHSQEFAADEGGVHDWASRGSLRSTVIDDALFTLPVGTMSRILVDEDGCHIVRVLAREDAKRASFPEVQPEIKKLLHDGGIQQRRNDYVEKLRERTPVWTVFDDETATVAVPAGVPRR